MKFLKKTIHQHLQNQVNIKLSMKYLQILHLIEFVNVSFFAKIDKM